MANRQRREPLENEGEKIGEQIELVVSQDDRGTCYVDEKNLTTGDSTQIAIFPAQMRVVTIKGQFGPELAQQDVAAIRASIFVKTMAAVMASGKVDFGS